MTPTRRERIAWSEVVERSAAIVNSYETSVTLRQLFYRLVSEHILPNTLNAYKELSRTTAVEVHRIALTRDQVDEYGLPPLPGKASDSRAAAFVARYGELMQVELDALDPNDLRALYEAALEDYWVKPAHATAVARERQERDRLVLPDVSGEA